MIFKNAKDQPLNVNTGTVPDVSGAMLNWFQPMTFGVVEKSVKNFQVVETMTNINFQGVWQPMSAKTLSMKPEGQQAWSWYTVHTNVGLKLEPDQVITYLEVQYRVMSSKNYELYGYWTYDIVEDYQNSGPTVVTP